MSKVSSAEEILGLSKPPIAMGFFESLPAGVPVGRRVGCGRLRLLGQSDERADLLYYSIRSLQLRGWELRFCRINSKFQRLTTISCTKKRQMPYM